MSRQSASVKGFEAASYNLTMFQALLEPLGREALAKLTLLINHVLAAEPVATERLRGQTGGTLELAWRSWLPLLPPPPRAAWRITPAGLLELLEDHEDAGDQSLLVSLDAGELGRWALAGAAGSPPMNVQGDAPLAAQVSWLADNLRWDIEDDLARVLGDGPARMVTRLAQAGVTALRALAQRLPRRTADAV